MIENYLTITKIWPFSCAKCADATTACAAAAATASAATAMIARDATTKTSAAAATGAAPRWVLQYNKAFHYFYIMNVRRISVPQHNMLASMGMKVHKNL